jgi:nucleotide-binding universal stress UspA family protein
VTTHDAERDRNPDSDSAPDAGPTVMVALSNPRTEGPLVTVAAALAEQREGTVFATHVVQVPDQTALSAAADNDALTAESERLLADAKEDAEAMGATVETTTILSHRGLEEVFDAARSHEVDAVVMGYGGARFAGGRAETAMEELSRSLPCDFLVLKDRDFDASKVLLPTAGGYSSDLSAEVARALRDVFDAEVSVLYVTDEGEAEAGRAFIAEWAADHDLDDAELLVETGDVEENIARAAEEATLVVIGATEKGLLSRVVGGSLAFAVLEDLDTSVLLAERPSSRSLRERLFGR